MKTVSKSYIKLKFAITLSNKDDCVQLISTTNHWTSYIVGMSIIWQNDLEYIQPEIYFEINHYNW